MLTWPEPLIETAVGGQKCAWKRIGQLGVNYISFIGTASCRNRAVVHVNTSTYTFSPPPSRPASLPTELQQGQWTHITNSSAYLNLCYSLGHLYGIGKYERYAMNVC